MFSLLRDAFTNNLPVTADFLIDTGKKNGVAIRIALTKTASAVATKPAEAAVQRGGKVLPASGGGGKSSAPSKKAKSRKSR
jgi:hypothetical protein